MPKKLLVMRHAKSSWTEEGLSDYQRPLNNRGLRVAPRVAEFVEFQGLMPEFVISSSATRAQTTAEIFANQIGLGDDQLLFLEELYLAPAGTWLEVIKRFADDSISTLLVVGHNPGLEYLVEKLSGQWESLPTAAIACFELDGESWSDLFSVERVTLTELWRPKDIGIQ